MNFFYLSIFIVPFIFVFIRGETNDEIKETTKTVTTDEDNIELDGGPVTEQVMDPNITMNKPGEPEEDDTEDLDDDDVDPNFNANRAIRDLAYFLRAHKFQDYDRRYYKSIDEAATLPYEEFPTPPLRSLHWEVHKNCDTGFNDCLRYLDRVVRTTSLKRDDDTVTIMRENKWNQKNHSQQILASQRECQLAQRRDNLTAIPFEGPIERFQWRTTASYYMCWYTMLGTPDLEFFIESCSNHANCLDIYGIDNKDPRANDDKPFACAMYSFCPDHCCPMKHIWYMKDCFQSPTNPCYAENLPADRKCTLDREKNQDFQSLVLNHINITCICRKAGYEWSSRFGICVDVNECSRGTHNCNLDNGQICINQPGSFACICGVGLLYNAETKSCVTNPIFEEALRLSKDEEKKTKPKVNKIVDTIVKALTRSSAVEKTNDFAQLNNISQIIITFFCIFVKTLFL